MSNHPDTTTQNNLNIEPWGISETHFKPEYAALNETLFALGNGQIGVRGAHDEGDEWSGTMQNDVFINGFYEAEPIVYPEAAFAFAKTNQFIVRVPNSTEFSFSLDCEEFNPNTGTISNDMRRVDFQTGVLTRSFNWTAPSGKTVSVKSERLVSFAQMSIVAVRYSVTTMNFTGTIELNSTISNLPRAVKAGDDPRVGASLGGMLNFVDFEGSDNFSAFTHTTHHSGLFVASAVTHDVAPSNMSHDEQLASHRFNRSVGLNETVSITKFASYITTQTVARDDLISTSKTALKTAQATGFDGLVAAQTAYLSDFWHNADVEIGGDDALQQGMRFSEFHLLQSAGRDSKTNIAAKGVTGAGYDGHYFWDTEIYMLPFFLHTRPEIARKLLEYRANTLDAARIRAREMAHGHQVQAGALFPWRTITGPECSSYFPAGTAQYHINADIAYAIRQYTDVTGDTSFLREQGAEVVFETARIWPALGHFSSAGEFGIYTVTGPDEYTALVNNNLFTNAMARHHLQYAVDTAAWMAREYPNEFKALCDKIDLTKAEIATWQRAAAHMRLPYNDALGLHAQDDAFFDKPVWDFANAPKDKYPLLLHYHPLVIYRHQVCKQPDVVLALMLLDHEFDAATKKRDYDYYEAITTHDSSLSSCIFSIVAADVGYVNKAYDYFMQTARLDLDNLHHNTQHGVHAAALAGSWMSVVYGFAGMRSFGGQLKFAPHLPAAWTHYQFNTRIGAALLKVRVDEAQVSYSLIEGERLTVQHHGQTIEVVAGQANVVAY